jgi:hypothetical protein
MQECMWNEIPCDGNVWIRKVDHLASIKELQDMIAVLIAFVPDMIERGKYLDWLAERRGK